MILIANICRTFAVYQALNQMLCIRYLVQSLHPPCEVNAINRRHLLSNESKTNGWFIEKIFKAGHLMIHKISIY